MLNRGTLHAPSPKRHTHTVMLAFTQLQHRKIDESHKISNFFWTEKSNLQLPVKLWNHYFAELKVAGCYLTVREPFVWLLRFSGAQTGTIIWKWQEDTSVIGQTAKLTAWTRWSNKGSLNFFSGSRAVGNIHRLWEGTYWRLWALWGNSHTWFWHHHSKTLSKRLHSAELTAAPTLPPEKQETFYFCQTVGSYWVVLTCRDEAHSGLPVTLAWFPQQKKIPSPDP